MAHEAKQYFEKTGKVTYWTNAMFGGMPTYQIYVPQTKASLFWSMTRWLGLSFTGSLKYYLILSLAAFIGLCCLSLGPWLSLLGAYSITFAANHIVLVGAGHLTKIAALGFVPLIFVGLHLLFNKNWKLGFLVFTSGLAGSISMNHIQMTYYAGMLVTIYIIFECFQRSKEKKINTLIRPGLAIAAGVIISFLANFSLLMGLQSYAKDTMRGGAILHTAVAQNTASNSASSKSGLGWDYAMQWSEGFSDLLSICIPGAVGGSSNETWSKESKMAQALVKNGTAINENFKLPLYWGKLPYTDGPDYAGILLILTFVMGLVLIKGPIKWFALVSAIVLILLSLGSHFSLMNKLVFNYLPYYNKFRAPNSILNVLTVLIPLFSMYSLNDFIKQNWTQEKLLRLFKWTVLPLIILLLVVALFGPSLFNMRSDLGDPDWKNNKGLYQALLDTRAGYLRSDTIRSLAILIAGAGLMYFFGLKKIKFNDFLLAFGLLIAMDLWMVAKRYVNASDFQAESFEESNFKPNLVDQEILKDPDLSYRVLDQSVSTYTSSRPSYFHKAIGGHSPAKLRRYQDMIDFYFSKNDMTALNMMNTKYFINEKGALQTNSGAMGNAWFVDTVLTVSTPDEEIASIKNIDPASQAIFLASDFDHLEIPLRFNKEGHITLTRYAPNELQYMSQTKDQQLAVFSEVWYGPNKGWHAKIDGMPAEHFRVDYLLRAMLVPAGNHTIEFRFEPDQIKSNQLVSSISGTIFGVILLISIGLGIKQLVEKPDETVGIVPLSNQEKKLK